MGCFARIAGTILIYFTFICGPFSYLALFNLRRQLAALISLKFKITTKPEVVATLALIIFFFHK